MWEQVIASVWGTTMNCEGKRNFRNDSRGGVSQKYWEVSEKRKKAILSQLGCHPIINCLTLDLRPL
jgi:hypothetical protein